MPIYAYDCPQHGAFERVHAMGAAPALERCACGASARRIFGDFQFTEDRRRFAGERISAATGMPIAQSRAQERAIEKALGIEFVSRAEAPEHIRTAREYGEHLRRSGERLPNDVAAAIMSPPAEKPLSLVEQLRKNPKRLGEIPSDRPIGGKPLPPFPADVRTP